MLMCYFIIKRIKHQTLSVYIHDSSYLQIRISQLVQVSKETKMSHHRDSEPSYF